MTQQQQLSDFPLVVLDDGDYFIGLNVNYANVIAPGFLQRRCYVGVTTPSGWECIGSFDRSADGRWQASINTVYDEIHDSDAVTVGLFTDRLDAIVALWGARHAALCRHQDR